MRLTINCSTRGRPEILLNTLEHTLKNIWLPTTTYMVSADADDEPTCRALENSEFYRDGLILVDIREREDSLGAKNNRMVSRAPADVYLHQSDYVIHTTTGFDQKILEAAQTYPDGLCIVYDRHANLSFPGINAITSRLVEEVGFFYPPYFPFWFTDHWIDSLARMMGRIAYCDIEIDASRKPPTQGMRDLVFWCEFFNRMAPEREACAKRIIGGENFEAPGWLKDSLIRNLPLTSQRDIIINNLVLREHAALSDRVEEEPRHVRLRENAQKLLTDLGQEPIDIQVTHAPHPHGVIFAVPNISFWVSKEFWQSALRTGIALHTRGIPWIFMDMSGDIYVDKVRNKLATMFVEDFPNAENFFFIDDDVGWPEDKVIEFLERDEAVIVGTYPKKQTGQIEFPIDLARDEDGDFVEHNGLFKVLSIAPTGFMRIKRWVFEKFADHYGTFIDSPEKETGVFRSWRDLFAHGIGENGQFWGEDTTFVRRCIGMGIDVWVDPNVEMTHRGSYLWKGKLLEHVGSVHSGRLEAAQ